MLAHPHRLPALVLTAFVLGAADAAAVPVGPDLTDDPIRYLNLEFDYVFGHSADSFSVFFGDEILGGASAQDGLSGRFTASLPCSMFSTCPETGDGEFLSSVLGSFAVELQEASLVRIIAESAYLAGISFDIGPLLRRVSSGNLPLAPAPAPVPLPAGWVLALAGVAALAGAGRLRRRS